MDRRSGWLFAAILTLVLVTASGALADWQGCNGFERDNHRGEEGRYCEIREMALPALGSLTVDATPNGGIRVESWDRAEIRVEAQVQVRGKNEDEAREIAAGIVIYDQGGRIRAESEHRDDWSVSYRIQAPRQTDLELTAINGGISVAGIAGRLRMETDNGGLSLDALGGDVVARTRNGGIRVELVGERWDGAGLDVETKNGGIKLEIPEDYSAELETGTVNGRIKVEFPVSVEGEIGRSVSATLGSGGATIRAHTTNGGVKVTRG